MIYPGEFEKLMREIADSADREWDYEESHIKADDLMCRTLEQLGYGAGTKVFREMGKWYS